MQLQILRVRSILGGKTKIQPSSDLVEADQVAHHVTP